MNYKELNDLYRQQVEMFTKWRKSLILGAVDFRKSVVNSLDVPDDYWESPDGKQRRRYIELIDITKDDGEKPVMENIPEKAITDNGEFLFGLSFTFEHAPNTFPKKLKHVPVGIRFVQNELQFCFWDTEKKQPMANSSWQSGKDDFVKETIQLVERNLQFDPFDGSQSKSQIGFIQD